jgi:hypothetical protein
MKVGGEGEGKKPEIEVLVDQGSRKKMVDAKWECCERSEYRGSEV